LHHVLITMVVLLHITELQLLHPHMGYVAKPGIRDWAAGYATPVLMLARPAVVKVCAGSLMDV
jgi:hypothetical protein